MRWNPLQTRRRAIIAILILALIPAVYLASYPLVYRALNGADDVGFSRLFLCLGPPLTPVEQSRLQLLQVLENYYFPPAIWILDNTPLKHPMMWIGKLVDVDGQMELDCNVRAIERTL